MRFPTVWNGAVWKRDALAAEGLDESEGVSSRWLFARGLKIRFKWGTISLQNGLAGILIPFVADTAHITFTCSYLPTCRSHVNSTKLCGCAAHG